MRYRKLGKTGLEVSEIGLGGEWLDRQNAKSCKEIISACEDFGINILDCWMSDPNVRTNIGYGIKGKRDKWIIQGHIGSTWQNGQYVRTRDLKYTIPAFEDYLIRMNTDYIDLGMIHYVDEISDFERILNSDFIEYVHKLKNQGKIRFIGMSTHNPYVAQAAIKNNIVDMFLFSINPAFDLMRASEDVDDLFKENLDITESAIAPERKELYQMSEEKGVGITVMKCYAGGRLFDAKTSPFGVSLTPVQCLHYALTRPAVSSVMVGFSTVEHVMEACRYEDAAEDEKDYASVLVNAPKHAFSQGQCTYCGHCAPCPKEIDIAMANKLYDLAAIQPTVSESVKQHYLALKHNAKDCIACGGCEKRCPFGVKVIEKMKHAKEIFGL